MVKQIKIIEVSNQANAFETEMNKALQHIANVDGFTVDYIPTRGGFIYFGVITFEVNSKDLVEEAED